MNEDIRIATDKLLAMYQNYRDISDELSSTASSLAKAKLRGTPAEDISNRRTYLQAELQTLSDRMTFASPAIWMAYKFEAYANEAQSIRTMHDFRIHCSKPDYICTKRFIFLNGQLARRGLSTLLDSVQYPDEMLICEALELSQLKSLDSDSQFNQLWSSYEYHVEDGCVSKWSNYKPG